MNEPILAIIIPCYNEEEMISLTIKKLSELITQLSQEGVISSKSFLYLVDDGSCDKTWDIISEFHSKNPDHVKALKFTRNFGNQNALIAGLSNVAKFKADCAITIDADLQQDETKIKEFVEKFKNGAQIVCGIRKDRNTDSFFKSLTASVFYKIMNVLGVKIKPNHSDYRLTSAKAMKILSEYKETNMFLRGLFYELGLKTEYVYFDVKPRKFGKSKFSFFALCKLALEGITSFSVVPLRIVYIIGLVMSTISFFLCLDVLYERFFNFYVVPGWATIVFVMAFIGGIQILCIGIIGEYLGQLFKEVKARPRYICDEELS